MTTPKPLTKHERELSARYCELLRLANDYCAAQGVNFSDPDLNYRDPNIREIHEHRQVLAGAWTDLVLALNEHKQARKQARHDHRH
ncbi:hypothetical protein [Streptomyces sp. NPDC057686]|uniref:hypothetical protein n=1 Tax=Streptomyces sp. NPDC057686 TaxID=3346212 RepID=UPI003695A78E